MWKTRRAVARHEALKPCPYETKGMRVCVVPHSCLCSNLYMARLAEPLFSFLWKLPSTCRFPNERTM